MPPQSGQGVRITYKSEGGTFGVPPAVVTGANRFRLKRGRGLKLARVPIEDDEVRDDGMTGLPRLGSKSVTGTLPANLSLLTFDPLLAAGFRGSWASGKLIQADPPVDDSFTIEQYLKALDATRRFTGCRVSSTTFRIGADARVEVEFGIVGADMDVLSGASAPFFTPVPAASTNPSLVSLDAAIQRDGIAQVDITAIEFTLDNRAAGLPVVGSPLTPDIWPNNATLGGSITCTRKDLVREADYLAETEFPIVVTLSEPGTANTLTITIPVAKFMDYEEALGEDGAMIATIPFRAGKDLVGADPTMISLVAA